MKNTLILILFLCASWSIQAQDNTDPAGDQNNTTKGSDYDWTWKQNGNTTFTPPPPDPVPVDGGVSLLLLAGGAYGLRELKRKKKR